MALEAFLFLEAFRKPSGSLLRWLWVCDAQLLARIYPNFDAPALHQGQIMYPSIAPRICAHIYLNVLQRLLPLLCRLCIPGVILLTLRGPMACHCAYCSLWNILFIHLDPCHPYYVAETGHDVPLERGNIASLNDSMIQRMSDYDKSQNLAPQGRSYLP